MPLSMPMPSWVGHNYQKLSPTESWTCGVWGQCGIPHNLCTESESTTEAPGTAATYGGKRLYLELQYRHNQNTYTPVHFGFAAVTDGTFAVALNNTTEQLEFFAEQTAFERILTFGGWTFSTDPSTYQVPREGVTSTNRATLAANVADVVDQYDLDGVDFDWECPSELDNEGIPAGSDDDGSNYPGFLTELQAKLPSDKTISIAAPGSYWYLKAFPTSDMASVRKSIQTTQKAHTTRAADKQNATRSKIIVMHKAMDSQGDVTAGG
ncbi:Killer toxin subunits alpha/beta [Cytospora mali]|uniref:Killer toxin subunits alpha/beta n=1 Tax=Cytospora mali TaxID=578113 RepID=A0A194W1F8_CYTMA|nr:Killer toxin subunits alpha/beta [Valsa mali]